MIDFEIIEKKQLLIFYFKNNFKTIQKLFRSIIALQKHEGEIYVLVL